jgi:hypothetical protein
MLDHDVTFGEWLSRRRGLDLTQAETNPGYFLGLLAEAHAKLGQVQEGLAVVAEALAAAPTTGRFSEAELHRLKCGRR